MAEALTSPPGNASPASGTHYDAIVIGSGHNGLIAGSYLAKAGKRVLVLERRSIIGGATVTEELFPGYRSPPAPTSATFYCPKSSRTSSWNGTATTCGRSIPSTSCPSRTASTS